MIPFIQRTTSRSSAASAGLARLSSSIAICLPQHLDRHRGDVVVRLVLERGSGLAGGRQRVAGDAGDAVAAARDRLDPVREPVVDAEPLQLAQPRVDPHVVRRPLQHAVHLPARLGHVLKELQQDVAARARAHLLALARPRASA